MTRWTNMDGMLHTEDRSTCACPRVGLSTYCDKCRQSTKHAQGAQGAYGGILSSCSTCDTEDWHDDERLMPLHTGGVILTSADIVRMESERDTAIASSNEARAERDEARRELDEARKTGVVSSGGKSEARAERARAEAALDAMEGERDYHRERSEHFQARIRELEPRVDWADRMRARIESMDTARDARQRKVFTWATDAFGADQMNIRQRALRLLEESIELYQAAGAELAQAHELLDFVFKREVGTLAGEIGGVGVTLLAFAEAAGMSAEACERHEVWRVLSKPLDHYRARNAAKNAAGFLARAVPAPVPAATTATACTCAHGNDGRRYANGACVVHGKSHGGGMAGHDTDDERDVVRPPTRPAGDPQATHEYVSSGVYADISQGCSRCGKPRSEHV